MGRDALLVPNRPGLTLTIFKKSILGFEDKTFFRILDFSQKDFRYKLFFAKKSVSKVRRRLIKNLITLGVKTFASRKSPGRKIAKFTTFTFGNLREKYFSRA